MSSVLETKNGKQGSPVSCHGWDISSGAECEGEAKKFPLPCIPKFPLHGPYCESRFPSGIQHSGNQSDACHMINLLLSTVFTPVS